MSAFTGPLSIREYRVDSDIWELLTPLVWGVGSEDGPRIEVPAGFISDGASIPPIIRSAFPRWGRKYRRPAILHDYGYRMLRYGTPHVLIPDKRTADALFLESMAACKVSLPVRTSFYNAVRLFAHPRNSGSYVDELARVIIENAVEK